MNKKFMPIVRRNHGSYILPIDINNKESIQLVRDFLDTLEEIMDVYNDKEFVDIFGLKVNKEINVYFKMKPYTKKQGGEQYDR